jgi:tRNA-2-methylthio-N6-dimethylallyladenosine synthase
MEQNKFYVETYGCQMNLSDSEIVQGLMQSYGYKVTNNINEANIILINTCSVREHAEERVIQRIRNLRSLKRDNTDLRLGVIGCMAERLKDKLFDIDSNIDVILGPDEYRKLPAFFNDLKQNEKKICTEFNYLETYDDIIPYRNSNISAWIPIMRGCNNFCSYCVVPYTRGKERSKSFDSILNESKDLITRGFKEIYLLGQNVNSYFDSGKDFSDLLLSISKLEERIRIRFMTSHPKNLSDKLIDAIQENPNICKSIHLPFQSGSTRILKLMNRNYTKESYLDLIQKIKRIIPEISLSTDIIVGYPSETDRDFEDTLDLLREGNFDAAFMFKYSPREGTPAYHEMDKIQEQIKGERLEEVIKTQQSISFRNNKKLIKSVFQVLVEGESKKSSNDYQGRLDNNKVVVFPKKNSKPGDFVEVRISSATPATLIAEII